MKDAIYKKENGEVSISNDIYPYYMMLVGKFATLGGFTSSGLAIDVLELLLQAGWRPPVVTPSKD